MYKITFSHLKREKVIIRYIIKIDYSFIPFGSFPSGLISAAENSSVNMLRINPSTFSFVTVFTLSIISSSERCLRRSNSFYRYAHTLFVLSKLNIKFPFNCSLLFISSFSVIPVFFNVSNVSCIVSYSVSNCWLPVPP